MKYAKDGAICCHASHFDVEVDVASLDKIPTSIDQEIARRKLAYWGYDIDRLTPEQQVYLYGETETTSQS